MAISSSIVDDHRGNGRGHIEHGTGRGLGPEKHAPRGAEDGVYELEIAGLAVDNPTGTDLVSNPVRLADGSTLTTEVRAGSLSIADVPGDGRTQDALRLETDSDNGRLRLNIAFDADQQLVLGELDTLSFDYYIDASSRTDVTPVIRLAIDADGNLATTSDRGQLVFEYAYQGLGPTTQDTWQTADLVGDDWNAWQRSNGQNRDQVSNITAFSDWSDANGFAPPDPVASTSGLAFSASSLVLGVSVALGSGNGTNTMYVDNLQVGGVTYDFTA